MIDSEQARWVDYYLKAASGEEAAEAVYKLLTLIDCSVLIDHVGNRELIGSEREDRELVAAQIAAAMLVERERGEPDDS